MQTNNEKPADNSEATHSKYSPSKIALLATCPGYVSRPLTPEEEEDDFSPSAVGTRVHGALETQNPDMLLTKHERSLYTAANNMVGILRGMMEKEVGTADFEVLPEHKFPGIRFNPDDPEQTGTADVLFRHGNTSMIIDYKMGMVPVSNPEVNSQFIYYGLLEFSERPECERIILAVIQPSQQDALKTAAFYRTKESPTFSSDMPAVPMDATEAMKSIASVIIRHGRDADNPYAYSSSPHVCPYCDRLATCKKITSMARNFSLKVLKDKDLAEGMIDSVGTAMDNPETLGSLLSFASIIGEANKVHKDYAKTLFACGVDVPGWKYASRGNTIKVDNDTFRAYVEQHLSPEEILDTVSRLPVAKLLDIVLERTAVEGASKAEKKAAKELLLKDLQDLGIVREVKSAMALLKMK